MHDADGLPSTAYAWYCVILLMGVYVNSFLDRQILSLLVGPMRQTTGLSDSQVGFLMGPAFAVFYTLAGLPLGWAADRFSRKWLVIVGQLLWSLASIGFGLGRGYGQLALARIGVGVGEASLSPSAYSLIADLFAPHRLARALSVYSMGLYVGAGMASWLGGTVVGIVGEAGTRVLPFVGERHAWQIVFFLVAAPTVPLTALLALTLREPRRRDIVGTAAGAGDETAARAARDDAATQDRGELAEVSLATFGRYWWANRGALAGHNLGFALISLAGLGTIMWLPEFFIRIHGYDRAFIGQALGLNTMIAGPLGVWTGGWLADRLAARGHVDAKMRVALLSVACWLPFGLMIPLAPTGGLALLLVVPAQFASAMPWGAGPAALQELVPNRMRGQASAVFLLAINLIGLGLGPQLLPLLTDHVFRDETQIHLSLLVVGAAGYLAAGWVLWRGLPYVARTTAYRRRWLEHDG